MDIAGEGEEVPVVWDADCLVWPLEQVPASRILRVEIHGVGCPDFLEKLCDPVITALAKEEMIVIWHQAQAEDIDQGNAPLRPSSYRGGASIVKLGVQEWTAVVAGIETKEEALIVRTLGENISLFYAAVVHVVVLTSSKLCPPHATV